MNTRYYMLYIPTLLAFWQAVGCLSPYFNGEKQPTAVLFKSDDADTTPQLLDKLRTEEQRACVEVRTGDHIEGNKAAGIRRTCIPRLACLYSWCCSTRPQEQANSYLAKMKQFEDANRPLRVLLVPGDRDFYDDQLRIPNTIIKRHGNLCYVAPLTDNLTFISCGVYPDKKTCAWLEKLLKNAHQQNERIILAMHHDIFNAQSPELQHWVSEADIKRFFTTIAPYNETIQEISASHTPHSYFVPYNDDGFICHCCGGHGTIVSLYDTHGKRTATRFYTTRESEEPTGDILPLLEEIDQTSQPTKCWPFLTAQRWLNKKIVNQWYTE